MFSLFRASSTICRESFTRLRLPWGAPLEHVSSENLPSFARDTMADSFQCRARLHRTPDPQDQASAFPPTCRGQHEFSSIPLQSVQFDGRRRRRTTLFKPIPMSTPNSCFVVHPQLVGPSAAPPIRMPRPRESLTTTNPLKRSSSDRQIREKPTGPRSHGPARYTPASRRRPTPSALHSLQRGPSSRSACLPFLCYGPIWIPPGADFQRCFTKLSAGSPAPHRRTRTVSWDSPRSSSPRSRSPNVDVEVGVGCECRREGREQVKDGDDIIRCDWYQVRDLYARGIPNLPAHVSIRRARAMLRTSTSDSARLASDEPIPPLYPVRCACAVREEQWRTDVLTFKVTRE
ncbi:hypothetical protein B0H13DRAFT_2669815 [Mycena leptocephala]|nr:hypothetical protein B0H13DRAFT_2669815 [Mycena leptocephala]